GYCQGKEVTVLEPRRQFCNIGKTVAVTALVRGTRDRGFIREIFIIIGIHQQPQLVGVYRYDPGKIEFNVQISNGTDFLPSPDPGEAALYAGGYIGKLQRQRAIIMAPEKIISIAKVWRVQYPDNACSPGIILQ